MRSMGETRALRAHQGGMVLIAVLGAAVLLALVGGTTLWLLKAHLRQVGDQRKDFQALHAAEAGIVFFQNRLNSYNLCHPWLTHVDSVGITKLMGDVTIRLPSPYGEARGFRITNAQLLPNHFPPRVRFESVGGAILPDGKVDLAHGRPVICEMRMRTMADFIRFTETSTMAYGAGAVLEGRVYSGEDLIVNGNIDFQRKVTYARDLVFDGPDSAAVVFREGHERTSNPYTLNHVHVYDAEPRETCGGGLPYTYEAAARGTLPYEGRGVAYSGAAKVLVLPLEQVGISWGRVNVRVYALDTTRADLLGALVHAEAVPLPEFNGVVYLDAEVWVRGTLQARSLTVAATDDIVAARDVRCNGNETGKDRRVTLGLIAQDKFFVWGQSPTRTTVEAAIMAEDDSLYAYGSYEDVAGISWCALGSTDSVSSTHPGVDASGAPADWAVPSNWILTMRGSIITRRGGSAGPWVGTPGRVRNYSFDTDNTYSPPPKFPIMRAKLPGVAMWEVTGWKEK